MHAATLTFDLLALKECLTTYPISQSYRLFKMLHFLRFDQASAAVSTICLTLKETICFSQNLGTACAVFCSTACHKMSSEHGLSGLRSLEVWSHMCAFANKDILECCICIL